MPPRFSLHDVQFADLIKDVPDQSEFELWCCQPTINLEAGAVVGMIVNPMKVKLRKAGDFAQVINRADGDVTYYHAFSFKTSGECLAYAHQQLVEILPNFQKDLKLKLNRFLKAETLVKNASDPFVRIALRANLVKFTGRKIISETNMQAMQEMIGICSI